MPLSTICLPVQAELKGVEEVLRTSTDSKVELVSQAAQYVLSNGGKRIRPALLLLTAKLLGAQALDAVRLAASVEMIHAASLMHDDVLDNAEIRRGRASANVKWGNQISILVGDFLWCKASAIAVSYKDTRILASSTEAVEATTEGEILEIVRSNDPSISEEDYLKIITLKTARLFACACELGAILAKASDRTITAMKNFGQNLGIAFQLADDVLDYGGNSEKTGKKSGTDMCEGRLTLPVIRAMKKCSADEAQFIKESLFANLLDVPSLNKITDILKRYGTLDASLDIARSYAATAKVALEPFKTSLEKDSLLAVADYAVSRSQ